MAGNEAAYTTMSPNEGHASATSRTVCDTAGPATGATIVLVVDDEPHNREIMARRLERAGYWVETAADGRKALDWLAKNSAAIVLLDYMMPEMNGFETLKILRSSKAFSDLPVIMVTAVNDSESVVEALNLGANDFITKPVDFPVALARIRSHLRRSTPDTARANPRAEDHGRWDWDLLSNRGSLSEACWHRLGYSENQPRPDNWLKLIHPGDRDGFERRLAEVNRSHENEFLSECRLLHQNGSYRWMLCRGDVRRDTAGAAVALAATLIDVTETKAVDPLTGLANRSHFTDLVGRRLEQRSRHANLYPDPAQRPPAPGFAVLVLSLERFKLINDTLGYPIADQLLREVARRIHAGVRGAGGGRPEDKVGRLDSDRFGILLAEIADEDLALGVARRLQRDLQAPFSLQGSELFTATGFGIVVVHDQYSSADDILRDAELALNRAQAGDSGRCAMFRPAMRSWAMERLRAETDLRRAVEHRQFEIYYQPKVDLISHSVVGFEALLRWNHPTRGIVLPADFIPILEETGLIVEVGRSVIADACADVRRWQRILGRNNLEVSVNVSVNQLRPELPIEVSQALRDSGLEPPCLQLEVTESVLMSDIEGARTIFADLKALGVGLKIDDFGTGYSSLNYLARLPFDWLKIDRSFTQDLCENEQSVELTRTMIGLATGLGMSVVAEGVETAGQAQRLQELGCRFGQGYLFARPMPADQALEFVRNHCACYAGRDGKPASAIASSPSS
ncbi:MAG: EAL domain-containing protein [Bryobacteraceae bacterium]